MMTWIIIYNENDDDGGDDSQVMGQCGGLDIGRATRHRSLPLRVADAEENNWLSRKPDIQVVAGIWLF